VSIHLFYLSPSHRNTLFSSCQATMSDGEPASLGLPSSPSHLVTSLCSILASLSPLSAFPPLHYAVYHSTVFSILSVVRVDVLFTIHVYNATLPLPLFTSLVPDLILPASRSYYTTRKTPSSDLSSLADLIFLPFLTFSIFFSGSSLNQHCSSSPRNTCPASPSLIRLHLDTYRLASTRHLRLTKVPRIEVPSPCTPPHQAFQVTDKPLSSHTLVLG
jgi:hypothetical protein